MKIYSDEIIIIKKRIPTPTSGPKSGPTGGPTPVPAKQQAPTKIDTIKKADTLRDPIIKKDCWLSEIDSLESYFNSIGNYPKNVRLDAAAVINDPALFLDSHFQTLKANNGNRYYLPFLDRLKRYRDLIESI